jgi:hypothetical protein
LKNTSKKSRDEKMQTIDQRILNKILFAFAIICTLMAVNWAVQGKNSVTGDEPHYLVMAQGILKYASFEQTRPYQDEFQERKIYRGGLEPGPHVVQGPNGQFNVHNIGLPLLLLLPFAVGGVVGAKLFMIALAMLIPRAAWRLTQDAPISPYQRTLAVVAMAFAMPFLPASSQIFPDMVAGICTLNVITWLTLKAESRNRTDLMLAVIAPLLMPWLQIKFSATALILAAGLFWGLKNDPAQRRLAWRFAACFAFSLCLLAAYNLYAFGNPSGPYKSGSLEISTTALMVLIGLHIDQNQGIMLQNPLYLLALTAVVPWVRSRPGLSMLTIICFASLIVPNAMHPVWYGGYSFSGRFAWAAFIALLGLPLWMLTQLALHHRRAFLWLCLASIALQLWLFILYGALGADMYNRPPDTWLRSYPMLHGALGHYLPAAFNLDLALKHMPNLAWLTFSILLISAGLVAQKFRFKYIFALLSVFIASLITFQSGQRTEPSEKVFHASTLPSATGIMEDGKRVAKAGRDGEGHLVFGPYFALQKGRYEASIQYSAHGDSATQIGTFEVYDATHRKVIESTPIFGSQDQESNKILKFKLRALTASTMEFRLYWHGKKTTGVSSVSIRTLDQ